MLKKKTLAVLIAAALLMLSGCGSSGKGSSGGQASTTASSPTAAAAPDPAAEVAYVLSHVKGISQLPNATSQSVEDLMTSECKLWLTGGRVPTAADIRKSTLLTDGLGFTHTDTVELFTATARGFCPDAIPAVSMFVGQP